MVVRSSLNIIILICLAFNLHQASSVSLTREQKYIVDRMVEAHRLYRAQESSHCRVGLSEKEANLTNCVFTPSSWILVCMCSVV